MRLATRWFQPHLEQHLFCHRRSFCPSATMVHGRALAAGCQVSAVPAGGIAIVSCQLVKKPRSAVKWHDLECQAVAQLCSPKPLYNLMLVSLFLWSRDYGCVYRLVFGPFSLRSWMFLLQPWIQTRAHVVVET